MQSLAESMNGLMPQAAPKATPRAPVPQRQPGQDDATAPGFRPQMMDRIAGAAPPQPFGPSPFGQGTQQYASFPQPVGYGYDGALEQPRQKNQLLQALAQMG